MTRDEIDVMWQQALHQSVQDGEQFTRYRFAALVAAKEREECAKVCELMNAWLRANGGGPWIACADKLPQRYVTCIVGRPDVQWPVTAFWTGEKWCRDVKDDGMHVTHWRPMPEAPSNAVGKPTPDQGGRP